MIRFKAGVQYLSRRGPHGLVLRPSLAIELAMWEHIDPIWVAAGVEDETTVITSIFDGKHSRWSEHWQGNGVDVRVWNLPGVKWVGGDEGRYEGDVIEDCAQRSQDSLGPDYRVFREPDHIHVDHRPQRRIVR